MKISVIIPTLNEAHLISDAVSSAWNCGAGEVIVVDGGSSDETIALAKSENCQLIQSETGRGIQINAGAKVATGQILLFLHADTKLDASGGQQILDSIAAGHLCGAFKQRIEARGMLFRWVEFGNAQRVRWLKMAYGDQGIFVMRKLFAQLGGFDEIPIMEDFSFSRKLKQNGHQIQLLNGPLKVNARHWRRAGVVRQTITNWSTIWRYLNGARPEELLRSRELNATKKTIPKRYRSEKSDT